MMRGSAEVLADAFPASDGMFQFSLKLHIDCMGSLWRAAANHCVQSLAVPADDIFELIGPAEDPSVEECLMVLMLPTRIPGCEMLDTRITPCSRQGTPVPRARDAY